ncbi:MAG: metallophosphoesterase [Bacteriovorax sp.]|jgi:UDP-2,3-diacylglucosamine pyrophosphatase LpxH
MKFLQKNKIEKTILVISDLHLSAGLNVNKRRNFLEDFHYDKELIEFIEYHSSGYYLDREVELIINGDFFDLLAVPYVKYFDDEFWSENAAMDKLKMIIEAHSGVIEALRDFISYPNNKVVYILGNHDAELVFESLRDYLLGLFSEKDRHKFRILLNDDTVYIPESGIVLKHGHEYEVAHQYSIKECIATDINHNKYFIPPWGSYYVTRVINKFKEDRDYINAVRPVNKFIINGIIYDTLYTFRFMFANFYYFMMVRFVMIFKQNKKLAEVFGHVKNEIQLFQNYESLTEALVTGDENIKALIVGHTHDPVFREYDDGSIFINTGTWTKMYNLDFGKNFYGAKLTFAKVDVKEKKQPEEGEIVEKFDHLEISLNEWRGRSDLPFREFR